jgi:hypothetical protein
LNASIFSTLAIRRLKRFKGPVIVTPVAGLDQCESGRRLGQVELGPHNFLVLGHNFLKRNDNKNLPGLPIAVREVIEDEVGSLLNELVNDFFVNEHLVRFVGIVTELEVKFNLVVNGPQPGFHHVGKQRKKCGRQIDGHGIGSSFHDF